MFAFAANSVLIRFALAGDLIGPGTFAVVRVVSGAVILAILVWMREKRPWNLSEVSPYSVAALSVYILGFSYAYINLDTGTGALILFGFVQVTMFIGALIGGERPNRMRWIGAGVAFAGLAYLLAPSARAPDPVGAVLMAAAGAAWGYYSIYGRSVRLPLQSTAGNFLLSVIPAVLIWVFVADVSGPTPEGVALAITSGAVTSGLGYALWYSVLPKLDTSLAAIAQLTVPVIALAGGIVFLGESLSLSFVIAAALILGGVAISLRR